jgi:regulator of protease activity HflC (stomatin/prohibitin superfamily)
MEDPMREAPYVPLNGWLMLPITIATWLAIPALIVTVALRDQPILMLGLIALVPAALLCLYGHFTLQPNQAKVMMLFGRYLGTVRTAGFHWANPFAQPMGSAKTTTDDQNNKQVGFTNRLKLSLRARNFETGRIKVNDQRGNPIEIGAVVVWQVEDSAQALFEVDDYEHYVTIQAETAVRHLAGAYPYDHMSDDEAQAAATLRGSSAAVSEALRVELQERLSKAGVKVIEARLTHLAYAPEIAAVMLRRQQAEAVIAARSKIVTGAVTMVQMALEELTRKGVVELDPERRAAMVGNLLVVLCADREAQPVLNTGTLYH